VLLEKQEAFCLELGNRSGLAYCYWNWGLLARKQRNRKTERENLQLRRDEVLRIKEALCR
jgi:hypothetical protein